MANNQIGTLQELVIPDKRRTAVSTFASTTPIGTPANYGSISALRTRLAAINGAYYTADRLDAMTVNDMQYAVKLSDDSAGV